MPRSFAAWNEKRRPIARCATSPHAQPPEGFSHTQPTSPQIQGLNIDELVSQLTEDELDPPALLPGAAAEWSPPPDTALIHPVAAGQPAAMVTDALPLAAGQMGPGTCAIAMHPAAHVPAHLHAPVGGPAVQLASPAVQLASRVEGSAAHLARATFAAAGPSSDEGTTEPPLVWSACRCPISADCNGAPIVPGPAGIASVSGYAVAVRLHSPLLYWAERSRWMWHKKWLLPRITVLVTEPPPPAGHPTLSACGVPLVAIISCGTLRPGTF